MKSLPWIVIKTDAVEIPFQITDPSDFINEISGTLYIDDESGEHDLLGKFRLYIVDLRLAFNHGYRDLSPVFNAHSKSVAEYYNSAFDFGTSDYTNSLTFILGPEPDFFNFLIFDRLEILPIYRQKNYGLLVMRRIIEHLSTGNYVIGIKPFPLQFENGSDEDQAWRDKMDLDSFSEDEKVAKGKLIKHYKRLGFSTIKGSPHMFHSTARELPSVEELFKE